MRHANKLLILSLLLWSGIPESGPPYPPEEALTTIEVDDGFVVELFASEPLIQDPVAMAIDEHGRVYVVEMPGYPLDASGSGRIKQLHDTDHDGYPDTASLFAEGLTLPNGVMPWKGGILVTDPPDVLYLKDNDGDGIADVREVVLTGFALSNPQHNANSPLYGLDNWIHIANNGAISWTEKYKNPFGDTGSEIFFPARPEAPRLPKNARDRNVRFRPDVFELQMRSGNSQFGHTFTPWGQHFLNDNSHPIYYEALAAPYLELNMAATVSEATEFLLDHGDDVMVFPITVDPEHQLLTDRGVFTSACGITWYNGGLFPAPYDADIAFVAEPTHNLVHVSKVISDGRGFTASRITEGREFLASTDSWFRPVNFSVGPDGAVYVVDYYRQIVEHPEWMDDAVVDAGDLHQGTTMGRIYRVIPEGGSSPSWMDSIELKNTVERVERLADPNGWWRMTAQRILVSEGDTSAIPLLRQQISESPRAEGRLHSLWTLQGLDALRTEDIRAGLEDSHAGVRENAIRLAEMDTQGWESLTSDLFELSRDSSARVRYQLLTTLGMIDTNRESTLSVQEEILRQNMNDQWVQVAALLSIPSERLFTIALSYPDDPPFLERVSAMIVRERNTTVLFDKIFAEDAGEEWWYAPMLRGMASANAMILTSQVSTLIEEMWQTDKEEIADAILELIPRNKISSEIVDAAQAMAQDSEASIAQRVRAVRVLSNALMTSDALLSLFNKEVPLDVQLEVLKGLQRTRGPQVAQEILNQWDRLTPQLRTAALAVFNNSQRAHLLIEALESGVVAPAELSWNQRVMMMRDTPEPTRSRARALLQVSDEVRSLSVEGLTGNLESGAYVYATTCASCHARGFGPNLATVSHWSEPMLTAAITNPSESISSGFELWQVVTIQGDTLSGIIASETASAVRLLGEFTDNTISRSEIVAVMPLSDSAMPEDLIPDAQTLADLMAFIKEL
ncbi:MAG: c-type cytochrome [Bacteroidetes bacterium]|nr:c-type cytochrome [Bacteroidota bacterium]